MAVVPVASRSTDPGGRVSRATLRSPSGGDPSHQPLIFPNARQQSAPNPVFRSSARATPDAFGAGLGRGLEQVGQGVSLLSQSLRSIEVQEQETELKTLDVEFSNRVRDLMYGNPDTGIEGYLSTQGDNAVGGHTIVRDAITTVREELGDTASSQKVRDRFAVAIAPRVRQAFTNAGQHATRARQQQAIVMSQAQLAAAENDAANDPAMLKRGLAVARAVTENLMMNQGHTEEEVIEFEVLNNQSSMVKVTIASALGRKDTEGAAAIYRENAEFMTADDRAQASVSLLQSLTLGEAQNIYDEGVALGLEGKDLIEFARQQADSPEIRAKVVSLVYTDIDRERAGVRFDQGQDDRERAEFVNNISLEIIDAVEDPVLRKALLDQKRETDPDRFTATVVREVREKLSTQATRDKTLAGEQLQEALSSASLAVNEGQSLDEFLSENPAFATELMKHPQSMATMRAVDRARATGNLFAANSDGATLHAIRTLTDEDRAQLDLGLYRHLMTPQEYEVASAAVAASIKAGERKASDTGGQSGVYASARRILTNILPADKDYGSRTASESDREFNRRATGDATFAIEKFIDRTGELPTEPELQDIVFESVANLYVEDQGIFGLGFLTGEDEIEFLDRKNLTPEQRATLRVPIEHISERRKAQLQEGARRGNKYPGGVPDDVLEDAYGAFIMKDHARLSFLLRGI